MKKRRKLRVLHFRQGGRTPALFCLSACFLCGIIAGCIWADSVTGSGGTSLAEYINGYLGALREGTVDRSGVLAAVWETARWPLITVVLAFTALGLIAIPVLFVVRGFLLSFSVACFIRILGSTGAILAFLLFGVTGALCLPVLFILGLQGVEASRLLCLRLMGIQRTGGVIYGKEYLLRCGLCAAILCISICLEQAVVPSLLTVLAGTF